MDCELYWDRATYDGKRTYTLCIKHPVESCATWFNFLPKYIFIERVAARNWRMTVHEYEVFTKNVYRFTDLAEAKAVGVALARLA